VRLDAFAALEERGYWGGEVMKELRNELRDESVLTAAAAYQLLMAAAVEIERLTAERAQLIAANNAALEFCIARRWKLQAQRDKLVAALQGLHDDNADYLRLNNLGGYDNHWMQTARATLAEVKP
jgi:hypothetical protein